jgi:hypothetical protein
VENGRRRNGEEAKGGKGSVRKSGEGESEELNCKRVEKDSGNVFNFMFPSQRWLFCFLWAGGERGRIKQIKQSAERGKATDRQKDIKVKGDEQPDRRAGKTNRERDTAHRESYEEERPKKENFM